MAEEQKRRLSKCYNKRTGITYVYEVLENYWDKELHQARNKRRMVGKIDPVTGEMVPTGKRGNRKKREEETEAERMDYRRLYSQSQHELAQKNKELADMKKRLCSYVQEEMKVLDDLLKGTAVLKQTAQAILNDFGDKN